MLGPNCDSLGIHVMFTCHSPGLPVGATSDFLTPGGDAVMMSLMLNWNGVHTMVTIMHTYFSDRSSWGWSRDLCMVFQLERDKGAILLKQRWAESTLLLPIWCAVGDNMEGSTYTCMHAGIILLLGFPYTFRCVSYSC